MSQAEALLNTAARNGLYTASPETEAHIVIGADRVIIVPDELKRLGVQFDHNIETVTFDCPRYWDEHDMSQMKVYVNYMRADGVVGSYYADDVYVDANDDTMMHFGWTISRNVTIAEGTISFLVCVRNVDDEGFEENHWNSELCVDTYISKGLESGEVIADQYPDIITQVLAQYTNILNAGLAVDLTIERDETMPGLRLFVMRGYQAVEYPIYDGTTPHIGDNGNWWIGDTDTGVTAAASTEGFMPANTYDPQDKATDIFKYVDDAVNTAVGVVATALDEINGEVI